ncbi:galactose-1-phosphate uridylyltransferase [Romboutsia lituseburensis]|uniref:galactose-1-phosphate uridylyltransferase n=1 Tax=Romboutsia lituseburensis TaxID=1537 RepID=UPI00215B08BB|nr:galactose-1-phosphate uridylyltransferase [Romboutsia lituseburensis]MCR8745081.1 galactose-1-phosphate uridylyltransferase [Romboutsia lituseburensis]
MQELRIDEINNDLVIVANNRSKRPMDKIKSQLEEEIQVEYDSYCPFCRGNESHATIERYKIEDSSGWITRSVDNKFPIVDELSDEIYGVHEVIIDTYRHNGTFYNMSELEFQNLFKTYKNRYQNLIENKNVQYVNIFKNFLRKSGASLAHPHSQIISLSIVPPEINKEEEVASQYFIENKTYLYDDIIKREIKYKKRVINDNKYFLTIVPYASKYSGEVRVIFKENIKFEQMSDNYIKILSKVFKKLFENLYKINGYNPFNLCIHTHSKELENSEEFNVHMHIIPRKYSFGGFELGTGMYVSSTNPEELANKLRFELN